MSLASVLQLLLQDASFFQLIPQDYILSYRLCWPLSSSLQYLKVSVDGTVVSVKVLSENSLT